MSAVSLILHELTAAAELLKAFMAQPAQLHAIEQAATLCIDSLRHGGKIISAGNGGSHCDAMHFAEELTGRYRLNRPAYAALAISDPSHLSCVANDFGYEAVFARYLEGLGQAGDVFLGISTSGTSAKIVAAAKTAKAKGMKIVILTGAHQGELTALADVTLAVPHTGYADRIQEIHIKIIHILILLIEQGMAPDHAPTA